MARPKYIARAKQSADSEYMSDIGVAFPFREGTGLVVKLNLVPVGWTGDFILVPPPEKKEAAS